ncbi:SMP-30/gluconolactonase/LRE family protein [Pseudochryseolinea flava]|uniref:SMP-30/gluconolactonase/LRE family protein n=1 Tax=Pseudochryseolinea flava TaxID=2059302 RepID=A0A364Y783_9BACT|nr:SMP-30/gluconolactonase/LRE family protein [Pseudochryseolinea flava]RAW02800.1 SMP-30/gluconolactonase/LRE family protein [Pseudochryseolinea flava]
MKQVTSLLVILMVTFTAKAQDMQRLFLVEDFTAENLFTNNIEGPCFDDDGNLYVVNFQKDGTIGKVKPDGKVELFLTLPAGSTANSIKFDSKGNMYLADFSAHNVLKVNMKTKKVSVYAHTDQFNQPNDLCINSRNQLFASDPNWKESTGKLWRIDRGGKPVLLTDQMGTTNGIELSPDEKTLYVNESVQRKIWAFDVDAKGNISNKRLFKAFEDFGFDGMKCDKEGNLYVTRYGKGVIAVLSPSGDLIREVTLKGKNCSNLVFGGLNGKLVFVTLQDRKGMEMFRNDIAGKEF